MWTVTAAVALIIESPLKAKPKADNSTDNFASFKHLRCINIPLQEGALLDFHLFNT